MTLTEIPSAGVQPGDVQLPPMTEIKDKAIDVLGAETLPAVDQPVTPELATEVGKQAAANTIQPLKPALPPNHHLGWGDLTGRM